MKFANYIYFLVGISLVLYFMNQQSILMYVYENQGGQPLEIMNILSLMADMILTEEGITLLLGVAVTGIVATFLGGYGATFLVPMIILLAVLNYLVFPFSFLIDPATPVIISIPLTLLHNVFQLLAVVDFISGGRTQ